MGLHAQPTARSTTIDHRGSWHTDSLGPESCKARQALRHRHSVALAATRCSPACTEADYALPESLKAPLGLKAEHAYGGRSARASNCWTRDQRRPPAGIPSCALTRRRGCGGWGGVGGPQVAPPIPTHSCVSRAQRSDSERLIDELTCHMVVPRRRIRHSGKWCGHRDLGQSLRPSLATAALRFKDLASTGAFTIMQDAPRPRGRVNPKDLIPGGSARARRREGWILELGGPITSRDYPSRSIRTLRRAPQDEVLVLVLNA